MLIERLLERLEKVNRWLFALQELAFRVASMQRYAFRRCMIITDRMSARMDGPFVVFLIGMRINRPWKLHRWVPVFFEMPRMLAELERQPELGMLGGHLWFGRTIILLQYWRSFEVLTAYARRPDLKHLPAWGRFRKNVGNSGDVGIWHETYRVAEGQYETIYHNMPPFGLGKVGTLVSSVARYETAAQRMDATMGNPAGDR